MKLFDRICQGRRDKLKTQILEQLNFEYAAAKKRQLPGTVKPSGFMQGLDAAIKTVQDTK